MLAHFAIQHKSNQLKHLIFRCTAFGYSIQHLSIHLKIQGLTMSTQSSVRTMSFSSLKHITLYKQFPINQKILSSSCVFEPETPQGIWNAGSILNDFHRFVPKENRWQQFPSNAVDSRVYMGLTAASNGLVYLFCCMDSGKFSKCLPAVWVSRRSNSQNTQRGQHDAYLFVSYRIRSSHSNNNPIVLHWNVCSESW